MAKKECGQVEGGSWYRYFSEVSNRTVFNDEIICELDELVPVMWGDFFERNLSPKKGPLISLGAGFGRVEIPLARRGYQVIGLDNDPDVLRLLEENAKKYAKGKLTIVLGDLYENFHKQFIGKGIQACVSFGVLEHFARPDLREVIRKQFLIAPLLICVMPIRTPATLKTFGAEDKPEENIDKFGIYRNFWIQNFWEKVIFSKYCVVDKDVRQNQEPRGPIDTLTLAVRENI